MVLAFVLSSCALVRVAHEGLRPPRPTLLGVHVERLSLEGAEVEATIRLHNPNAVGLSLSRASYVLRVDRARVFDGVVATGLALPADGDVVVAVPLEVSFHDVEPLLHELEHQREAPYTVDLRLSFLENRLTIPLHFAGRLPVPRRPKVRLAGAKVEHVGFKHERLLLELRLENPNAFVLPLAKFDGEALVDDHRIAAVSFAAAHPLAPNADELVEVPVELSLPAAGVAAVERLVHRGTLRLRGDLQLGGRRVPIDLTARDGRHD